METNTLPKYDMTDNPAGCCPRFDPEGWDRQNLRFDQKCFVRVKTRGLFHIPLNMGAVFKRTFAAIEQANAQSDQDFIVLSRDLSLWSAEHFFSVTKDVPGQQMVHLSGDYITAVFEGPFKDVPKWSDDMQALVRDLGKTLKKNYFFYTTCPKCAKFYGKNYVVAVGETA